MMWTGIEPWSPGPLANTLPTRPMSWFCHDIFNWDMGHHEELKTKTGYSLEVDAKIHSGNIMAWVHPQWVNSGVKDVIANYWK